MSRPPQLPNAENCSLAELEVAMNASPTRSAYRRMLAIRTVLLGYRPSEVALMHGVSRQSMVNWINRFNARGIDGLIERARPGRPRKIPPEHTERLRQVVAQPSLAGQVHWTARKFHGYLREQLDTELSYSTALRWLHENDFALKVPQPWPDRQDEEVRSKWLEDLRLLLADPDVELWYGDEMGVEGDPRPRRRWAKKGEKARITKNGDHLRMNVCGAVCPRTGQFYALEFTHSNRAAFQVFLDHASADMSCQRKRNILIVDNASWHKSSSLHWGAFEPLFLPPYSPDLNPIERLWLIIKAEWFTDFIAKDRDALIDRLDSALLWAMDRTHDNKRTCSNTKYL